MAKNVTAQVTGGQPKVLDGVKNVEEAKAKLGLSGNYTATINGQPAEMKRSLRDFDFISFAEAVKGGMKKVKRTFLKRR
jgi:hypothetical protein